MDLPGYDEWKTACDGKCRRVWRDADDENDARRDDRMTGDE